MNYTFNFLPVWQNLPDLLRGLGVGLGLAMLSLAIGMALGLVVAFGMVSPRRYLRALSSAYVTFLRNIPLLLIIYFAFLGLPQLGIRLDKYTAFIGSLTLYGAAYMAEIFRGGLRAVPRGVVEAGRAIGLGPMQVKRYIILPILFQKTRPALGNAYISLFKDTSLAAAIAVPELTFYARKLNLETFRILETWLVASLLYVATAFIIANALRYLDWRAASLEGRQA
jgi:His/Glu/Gln/Arg/opine family amino acid ABC transporter permease subunit